MAALIYRVITSEDGSLTIGAHGEAPTLDAASAVIPDGGYTTLRTYGKSGVIVLSHHFDRLEESALLLGHPVRLERDEVRHLLCAILRQSPWQQTRVRITVDCTDSPGDLWIAVEPLQVPERARYTTGVAGITRVMRRDNPRAKYTSFISASHAERQLVQHEINEVLMVSETGEILEGLSSNFFAFYQGNLYTAGEGVLHGITRTLIIEEALRASIPVRLEPPRVEWLPDIEEAFISSASRAVLPVTRVNDTMIGNGFPGPVSRLLLARYEERLKTEIEEVC